MSSVHSPESERLDALILDACERFAGSMAVRAAGSTNGLTFGQLSSSARNLAEQLVDSGHRRGSPVLLAVDNHPQDFVSELAIWIAGGVAVPVHRNTPAHVVDETARRTGAAHMVCQAASLPDLWSESSLLSIRDGDVHSVKSNGEAPKEFDENQAFVIFTSGSTGKPKGVVLSHRGFVGKLAVNGGRLSFSPGSTTLQVLQLHFSMGQWTSLLTLATGGELVLQPRFAADSMLEVLAGEHIDRVPIVPTMFRLLLGHLDSVDATSDVVTRMAAQQSPSLWIAGGEPLAAGLGRKVRTLLPWAQMTDVFGLSETSTSDFIVPPDEYDEAAGTIGYPSVGVDSRIMSDVGEPVSDGEIGELWLKSDFLMTGYMADPEATTATMCGDWLKTGDMGRQRSDGRVELVGRSKQLICRGAVKVSPLEIEAVYSGHPSCVATCAVGVVDDVMGERIHLLVVATNGSEIDKAQFVAWGRDRLEHTKVPDVVHLVDELPLGRTGKLDRSACHDLITNR